MILKQYTSYYLEAFKTFENLVFSPLETTQRSANLLFDKIQHIFEEAELRELTNAWRGLLQGEHHCYSDLQIVLTMVRERLFNSTLDESNQSPI